MSAELRRVLRELYVASGQRPRFVFACESGRAPSYRNARRALDGAITAAEIEWDDETHRLSFHCLRHGAVSALIRNGADPVRVARFVGDKVETLLSTYAQEWAAAQGDDLADVLGAALSVSG
jgi:integrase